MPLTFRIDGGPWFDLAQVTIKTFRQTLNLLEGVLVRTVRFLDQNGRDISLTQRRFVHMGQLHLGALRTELTSHNWSGSISVRTALNAEVVNAGIKHRSPVKHLRTLERKIDNNVLFLRTQFNQSRLEVCQAACTRVSLNGKELDGYRTSIEKPEYVGQDITVDVNRGDNLIVDKIASLYTSRDYAISEAGISALEAIEEAKDFEILLEEHSRSWRQIWRQFDISIETTDEYSRIFPSLILHLHSFHLLQTASPNSVDFDVGMPARGWTGEAYHGHVFWDDLFVFPFINLRYPAITQSLLKYRYRRLPAAKKIAQSLGVRGARFPWESASSGREETPAYQWNAYHKKWRREHTYLEVHVNAAIAYNIWQYYQATSNLEFMYSYGAEMLFEIARFFASYARYNRENDRYEIRGVVGPDEYHSAYPGADHFGINNNAYTNVMAAWTLCRALDLLSALPMDHAKYFRRRLAIDHAEIALWEKVSRRMLVPLCKDGIIDQFEGYHRLQEFPRDAYGRLDLNLMRSLLDEQAGQLNQFKISKQADVIMLFYLLSPDELGDLFQRLGYTLTTQQIVENIRYYMSTSVNTSTLSRIVNSWVLSKARRMTAPEQRDSKGVHSATSWQIFLEALGSDLSDIQGGTTPEGIHVGAMGGTIDIIQRCYTGLVTRDEVLWLDPQLPTALVRLSFNLHYQQQALRFQITHDHMQIIALHSSAKPIKIGFRGQVYTLRSGQSRSFSLLPQPTALSA